MYIGENKISVEVGHGGGKAELGELEAWHRQRLSPNKPTSPHSETAPFVDKAFLKMSRCLSSQQYILASAEIPIRPSENCYGLSPVENFISSVWYH